MAKEKKNGQSKAGDEAGEGMVRLVGPKGTAAIGIPAANGDVVELKVGKDGMVTAPAELEGKLLEAGFTRPKHED